MFIFYLLNVNIFVYYEKEYLNLNQLEFGFLFPHMGNEPPASLSMNSLNKLLGKKQRSFTLSLTFSYYSKTQCSSLAIISNANF